MSNSLTHFAASIFLLILLVFFNVIGVLDPVMDLGRKITEFSSYPIESVLEKGKNFFSLIVSLRDLANQNQILTRQVGELNVLVANLQAASAENEKLRKSLLLYEENSSRLIPAEVIGYNPYGNDQIAVINRGKNQGIVSGDAVVVAPGHDFASGILVGVVREVFDHTAQIELITSSQVKVNAATSSSGVRGIIRGEHGLGLVFDLVSQNEVLNSGDRVITSGLGEQFPSGLLIGSIDEVVSGQEELFQRANITPAVNLQDISFVFVIQKK